MELLLCGPDYDGSLNNCSNTQYLGLIHPDILPRQIKSDFGILWDGPSIESCDGPYGNYMKYIVSHKLSLYLAAGIPIIAWRHSGSAPIIERLGIGILVESLSEAIDLISSFSDRELEELRHQCSMKSRDVKTGKYLIDAMGQICSLIG